MNHTIKRYRQSTLFESFAFSKRPKSDLNMEEITSNRELFSAAEEKITSSQSDFQDSLTVCQAVEDASLIRSEKYETDVEKASTSETETKEMQHTDNSFKYSDDLFPSKQSDDSEQSSDHSGELFTNSEPQSSSELNEISPDSDEEGDMPFLNRMPDCSLPLPKLEPSANHFIMFSPHIRPGDAPRPYPSSYKDKWDGDHVRMPCSSFNRYPVKNTFGEQRIENRWHLICQSLKRDIGSSKELEAAIMKYNIQYIGKWRFDGLHAFINVHLNEGERDHFFEIILPAMTKMALELPNICTQPVPLLKRGKDQILTLSQKQIGCLLLNAFFCTFPRRTLPHKRNKERWTHEFGSYPHINFNRLFFGVKNRVPSRNAEKLKCIFNYFKRITSAEPSGIVTFHRQCIPDHKLPRWESSTRGIRTSVIKSSGLIEDEGRGMRQVDFANRFVGGGVIGQGCVQEEIRFIICPELIVSQLFTECLEHNEVLIITGVEQYNKYSGYADSFMWEGDFRDETPRDMWGRRYTQLVAMDALNFINPSDQFKFQQLKRELNKAYCGFYENSPPVHLPAVATGNWGCGAFKGNPKLKFLIQLMAASEAGRSLVYFTFGNKKLKTEMHKMYKFLSDKNLAIGDIWRLLQSYINKVSLHNREHSNLYDFIYSQFVIQEKNCRQQDDERNEDQILDDSDKNALNKLIEDVSFSGSSTEIEDGT